MRGTLTTVNRIAFGTVEEADAMKRRMDAVHGRVQGTISAGMPGSQHYSAFEPDLLLWVLATLIDATIKGYEFVWQPLAQDRRERLHTDFRKFGTFFGLTEDYGPQSYAEHQTYFDEQLASDLLGSHPLCAEIAAAVVRPPAPWRDRFLGHFVDFLPIETVPPNIREKLQLKTTFWTRQRMTLLKPLASLGFRVLPKRLTYYPESYRAERRLRQLTAKSRSVGLNA